MADNSTRCSWLYHPEFPEHWTRQPLYPLASWVNGLAFRNIQFSADGMPVIKIAEIKGGITGQTKFTQQVFDESVRVKHGDMLFSWSGQPETSIDVFWWYGPEGWLNQHVFRVTPAACVDRAFFYYLLRYLKPNFVGIASNKQTTGLGHVTKRDLENIEVAYPGIREQQAIACILGTLDDKIELNRRMNQTLEEMARAIFKSWFVDFDPVHAKAAVRREHPSWTNEQVSRAACPNLKPEISALFPDSFEDSELGKIPKGWEVTTLGDFVEFVKGRSYRSDELSSSDTALVTLKSFVRGGGYRIDGLKPFTGAYIPKQVVEPGEVVLACTDVTQAGEVIGRTAIVRGSRTYSCLVASLDVLIIRPRPPLTRSFVYELGRSADFVDHTYAHTIGTTVLHLSTDAVAAFPFAMPPSALIDRYDQIAVPIIQRSEAIGGDSEMLAAIRDALLPKLISNELRIPDAESFIARAQAAAMEATS
jgi:type I restriction enzyme S subunit